MESIYDDHGLQQIICRTPTTILLPTNCQESRGDPKLTYWKPNPVLHKIENSQGYIRATKVLDVQTLAGIAVKDNKNIVSIVMQNFALIIL